VRSILASVRSGWKEALLAGSMLLLCLPSVSCAAGSTSADGGPPAPATATISFCDDAVSGCPTESTFSLATIRDLVVKVDWFGVPAGNHSQAVRVLLPDGGTFELSQTGFLIDPRSDSSFLSVRSIPLAGSWVTQRRVTGTWSVEVSLDGQLVSTRAVEMTP
jgi:hypothetical protein